VTRRIVVYGGTFDPVHNGHLAVAEQVLEQGGAQAVWFVPAKKPPLRPPPQAPLSARLDMLRAVTLGRSEFDVLDIEARRLGVSHTIETITQLHAEHPDDELAILLGADAASTIARWPGYRQLLAAERFVIVNRKGAAAFDAAAAAAAGYELQRTRILDIVSPAVSASEVRRRAAAGQPLDGLVPRAVAALIAERSLYRD